MLRALCDVKVGSEIFGSGQLVGGSGDSGRVQEEWLATGAPPGLKKW